MTRKTQVQAPSVLTDPPGCKLHMQLCYFYKAVSLAFKENLKICGRVKKAVVCRKHFLVVLRTLFTDISRFVKCSLPHVILYSTSRSSATALQMSVQVKRQFIAFVLNFNIILDLEP